MNNITHTDVVETKLQTPKGRKFVVLIVMTIVNVLYVGACGFVKELIELWTLIASLNAVYAAYMGVNVWQKRPAKTTVYNTTK